MTKEELNQKREELGEEIIKNLGEIKVKIREYAELAGETRMLVFIFSGHIDDDYTDARAYVRLSYLREKYNMTTDEALTVPDLFSVTQFDNGEIHHRLAKERFLGEDGKEEER